MVLHRASMIPGAVEVARVGFKPAAAAGAGLAAPDIDVAEGDAKL